MPKLARLELGVFINDDVAMELDTVRKRVILTAVARRQRPPVLDLDQPDMLPVVNDDASDANRQADASPDPATTESAA